MKERRGHNPYKPPSDEVHELEKGDVRVEVSLPLDLHAQLDAIDFDTDRILRSAIVLGGLALEHRLLEIITLKSTDDGSDIYREILIKSGNQDEADRPDLGLVHVDDLNISKETELYELTQELRLLEEPIIMGMNLFSEELELLANQESPMTPEQYVLQCLRLRIQLEGVKVAVRNDNTASQLGFSPLPIVCGEVSDKVRSQLTALSKLVPVAATLVDGLALTSERENIKDELELLQRSIITVTGITDCDVLQNRFTQAIIAYERIKRHMTALDSLVLDVNDATGEVLPAIRLIEAEESLASLDVIENDSYMFYICLLDPRFRRRFDRIVTLEKRVIGARAMMSPDRSLKDVLNANKGIAFKDKIVWLYEAYRVSDDFLEVESSDEPPTSLDVFHRLQIAGAIRGLFSHPDIAKVIRKSPRNSNLRSRDFLRSIEKTQQLADVLTKMRVNARTALFDPTSDEFEGVRDLYRHAKSSDPVGGADTFIEFLRINTIQRLVSAYRNASQLAESGQYKGFYREIAGDVRDYFVRIREETRHLLYDEFVSSCVNGEGEILSDTDGVYSMTDLGAKLNGLNNIATRHIPAPTADLIADWHGLQFPTAITFSLDSSQPNKCQLELLFNMEGDEFKLVCNIDTKSDNAFDWNILEAPHGVDTRPLYTACLGIVFDIVNGLTKKGTENLMIEKEANRLRPVIFERTKPSRKGKGMKSKRSKTKVDRPERYLPERAIAQPTNISPINGDEEPTVQASRKAFKQVDFNASREVINGLSYTGRYRVMNKLTEFNERRGLYSRKVLKPHTLESTSDVLWFTCGPYRTVLEPQRDEDGQHICDNDGNLIYYASRVLDRQRWKIKN